MDTAAIRRRFVGHFEAAGVTPDWADNDEVKPATEAAPAAPAAPASEVKPVKDTPAAEPAPATNEPAPATPRA